MLTLQMCRPYFEYCLTYLVFMRQQCYGRGCHWLYCGFLVLIQVHSGSKLLMYSTFDWHVNKKWKRNGHKKTLLFFKRRSFPWITIYKKNIRWTWMAQYTFSVLQHLTLLISYILTFSQCLPVLSKRKSQNIIHIKKMHFFIAHISRQSYSS